MIRVDVVVRRRFRSVKEVRLDADFRGELVQLLYDRGVPEDQLQALFNEDASHPQFCQAQIAFLEAVIDLEGAGGEAVRAEVSQAMLVATP